MSFCLTGGVANSCADSCAGGIGRVWIAPADAVDTVTTGGSDGEVDSITMVLGPPAGVFYEFDFYQETASFSETLERAQGNASIVSSLTGSLICRSQAKRNAIMELASCSCGLVVIHEEASGKRWIWGLTKDYLDTLPFGYPAQLVSGEGVSGAAITDNNQETITVESKAAAKALELDSSVTIPV